MSPHAGAPSQDLARTLRPSPRGIEVGSTFGIHQVMNKPTGRGVGILMISSELPEVLGMSDSVLILRQGTIVGELARAAATEEALTQIAVGGDLAHGSAAQA
jgi:ribose transport system ATP-binding protein